MKQWLRALTTGGAALALAVMAGTAACGSGTAGDATGAGDNDRDTSNGSGAITVSTTRGEVKLPGPATKVVSLEWSHTENLMALGLTPIGNADNDGYGDWVTAPGAALPGDVTDVGTRQEPSIEKIKVLQPDLIVTDEDRAKAHYDRLRDIAPVLSFDPTTEPQLQTMKHNFTELAKAVGRSDTATEVLQRLDHTARQVKDQLQRNGNGDAQYVVAQGFTAGGAPQIRMHTDKALIAQVINLTGLRNAWDGKPDEWGMTTVGVEALTRVPDQATFLYVANDDDNPFTGELADNATWKQLGFVEADRVRPLDPGTWFYGGPLSAIQALNETGKAFGA